MDGQNYLVFHNDSDDSYMNSTANFRGADAGATFIDLYFASATYGSAGTGYDKVRLTVTAGQEEQALEDVGAAMAGAKNPVMVVADDVNSLYVSDHVTAVASITLASQVQTRVIESLITTEALAAADSGKILMLNLAAGFTTTLPSVSDAGAGWYVRFVIGTNCTSNDYIITEKTSADTNVIISQINEIETDTGQEGPTSTGHTLITIPNATDTVGDFIDIFCDGTNFYATGQGALDGFAALS